MKRFSNLRITAGALAFSLAVAFMPPVAAQELEPRSFINLPIDQTFLAFGVARSEGDLSPTPTSPLQDAELEIDLAAFGLSHTLDIAGSSGKVDFIFGRMCYEGSAFLQGEYVEGRRCEYADPKLKFTWNFYGAPALAIQDFANHKPGLVVGVSVKVDVPVGTYDPSHLINAGANRWAIKPTLGASRRFGRWYFEGKAGVTIFEDNDNFYNGIHVERDPLYATSAHVIYNLSRGSWLSLDANYFSGGRSTLDGVRQDDRQDNSRWGVTWSKPLGRRHIVKIYAHTGVVTRIGNDFDTYGASWVYRL